MNIDITTLEIIATVLGIIAVILQAKEKIAAWPIAIVNVSIAAYIYYMSKLYSDFGLHIIYIYLNFYGWYFWQSRKSKNLVISTRIMNENQIMVALLTTILGTALLGFLMSSYTDADLPYFDAFTTSGSLVAQYLLAKKYLQNWLLWIIVDIVAIPLYLYKELNFFAFLFAVYLLICIWGYFSWKKQLSVQEKTMPESF